MPHTAVRSTMRRYLLPTALAVVGALAIACSGDDSICPPVTAVEPPPRAILGPTYVLNRVEGQDLPFVTEQTGTRRVRVLADTLRFTPSGVQDAGTFTSATVIGTQDGTQAEVVSVTRSSGRFTRTDAYDMVLSEFMGATNVRGWLNPANGVQPGSISVLHRAQNWTYTARP